MMTDPIKTIVAQALAISVAVGGIWYLVVRPLDDRLASDRAKETRLLAEHRVALQILAGDQVSSEEVLKAVHERTRDLTEACKISGDAASMYTSIGEVASGLEVRVERMEPKKVPSPSRVSSGSRSSSKERSSLTGRQPSLVAFGYSMEVVESYGRVAELMDTLEKNLGVSKLLSFRLTPLRGADGRELVRATIDTAHYHFDSELEVLASAGGGEE